MVEGGGGTDRISIYKGIKMNGLWMGRYLRRWNRNTLVPRQPLTNDGPSVAIAAAPATPPLLCYQQPLPVPQARHGSLRQTRAAAYRFPRTRATPGTVGP